MFRWFGLLVTGSVSLTAAPVPQLLPVPIKPSELPRATQPETGSRAELASRDPLAFLLASQKRSTEKIHGYRAILRKQELLQDVLQPLEVIEVSVREEPFAIVMRWREGERKVLGSPVQGVLFIAGENQGQMKVWRPKAFLKIVDAGPADSTARGSARYALHEGGLLHAMKRTIQGCTRAEQRGTLQLEYLGCKEIPELGGRKCEVFRRTCEPAEVDSFLLTEPAPATRKQMSLAYKTLTIMIDVETGLQLGAEQHRADGALIGSYYFELQEVNPRFAPGTFSATSFK
jgi:hypothetical protein